MAKLKSQHKELIVKQLACYYSPTEIKQKLKDDHGVDVSASQISFYHPENSSSSNLAKKWRELFRHTRNRYVDEVFSHEIAMKGYRLGELQKMYNAFVKKGNYIAAAELLEQAAKEVGGAFESNFEPDKPVTVNNYIQNIYKRIGHLQDGKNPKNEVTEAGK